MTGRGFVGLASLVMVALAALLTATAPGSAQTFVQSPTLSKFTQELRGVGPAGIPVAVPDGVRKWHGTTANHYTIDINEFTDTLHPDLPPTTLWG